LGPRKENQRTIDIDSSKNVDLGGSFHCRRGPQEREAVFSGNPSRLKRGEILEKVGQDDRYRGESGKGTIPATALVQCVLGGGDIERSGKKTSTV